MQVVSHIYKSKTGRLYLLQSENLENGKLLCWTGVELLEKPDGLIYIPSSRVYKGALKKDVLKQIQNEIIQK